MFYQVSYGYLFNMVYIKCLFRFSDMLLHFGNFYRFLLHVWPLFFNLCLLLSTSPVIYVEFYVKQTNCDDYAEDNNSWKMEFIVEHR